MAIIIAIDAMSGDRGPAIAVAAMKAATQEDSQLEILAVGIPKQLEPLVGEAPRIKILAASEVIAMTDEPLKSLRRRNSSMFKAVEAVRDGRAQGAVSAGNTGVLMGMARIQLKMIANYHRPAIASFIPCNRCNDSFCMLDLGANIDRTSAMLVSFAYLGNVLHRAVRGSENPRVALLNIGEESIKGSKEILEAGAILQNSALNFIGNIEANTLFENSADVVVCDGFTGNIFLKTMEGLSSMIKGMLHDAFSRNLVAKLGALASMPVLNDLKETMDARRYNGAALLGLRGLVVKSHGNADEVAFQAAIEFAVRQARQGLVEMIGAHSQPLA